MNLRIERLDIDLKGISPETGREVADGLGEAILHALSAMRPGAIGGPGEEPRLDAGAITLGAGARAPEIRAAVARKIVAALAERGRDDGVSD